MNVTSTHSNQVEETAEETPVKALLKVTLLVLGLIAIISAVALSATLPGQVSISTSGLNAIAIFYGSLAFVGFMVSSALYYYSRKAIPEERPVERSLIEQIDAALSTSPVSTTIATSMISSQTNGVSESTTLPSSLPKELVAEFLKWMRQPSKKGVHNPYADLLSANPSLIDTKDSFERTPLHLQVEGACEFDIIERMLTHHQAFKLIAVRDLMDETPVYALIKNKTTKDRVKVMELLLKEGGKRVNPATKVSFSEEALFHKNLFESKKTPFDLAIENQDHEMTKLLMDIRLGEEERTLFHLTVLQKDSNFLDILWTYATDNQREALDKEGNSILHTAAMKVDFYLMQKVLDLGVSAKETNLKGDTFLHILAREKSNPGQALDRLKIGEEDKKYLLNLRNGDGLTCMMLYEMTVANKKETC